MPQTAPIERVRADADFGPTAAFAPSFDDLLASGEPELMRGALRGWLAMGDRGGNRADATYVYEEWLRAGGEPEMIRESLAQWLAGNATTASNAAAEEASFVCQAWLRAGGEPELVRDALGAWAELHGQLPVASFLYRAWLSAGGEVQAFSGPICDWLAAHTND